MPRRPKAKTEEERTERARESSRAYRARNLDRGRAAGRAYAAANPEKVKANRDKWNRSESGASAVRAWHGRNPGKRREWFLKYSYGITRVEWDAIFESQGCKCALCGSTDPNHRSGWATDHDHQTGRVRGILCQRCNLILGYLGDSSDSAAAAYERIAAYLGAKEMV